MISEEIAKKISKFIVDLKYEDIPEIAIKKAKICLIDYLTVRNRGMEEKSTKIAIKTMNQLLYSSYSSYSQYSQYSLQGSPLIEGFINGIASHTLDFDDGHKIAQLHPGTVVFSSAIAISKDKSANITGKEFLEAIIVGYEIAILLGEIANPHHRNQGFHSTGTIGAFAAGATIAKLLKLNISQTIATLGLCGTQSGGLLESDHQGTMGKSLHVGNAVYNGILSAFLAKNGFSAPKSIVGGKEGFLKAMAKDSYDELNKKIAKNNSYLSDYLNQELGKFHITEVYFKKYPVCRHLHSAIDSIIALRSKLIEKYNNSDKNSSFENIVDKIINNIDEIAIETYKIAAEHNNYDPKTKEDLKQSLPYSIAIAFVFGDLNLDILDNFNIYNNSNTNNNYNNTNINNKNTNTFNNNPNTNNSNTNNTNNNYNINNNNINTTNTFNPNINTTNSNSKGNSNSNDFNFKDFEKYFLKVQYLVNKIVISENKDLNDLFPNQRPSKVIIKMNSFDSCSSESFKGSESFEEITYIPKGDPEKPFSKEDILYKFKILNSDFDLEVFSNLETIESSHIYDFLDYFY